MHSTSYKSVADLRDLDRFAQEAISVNADEWTSAIHESGHFAMAILAEIDVKTLSIHRHGGRIWYVPDCVTSVRDRIRFFAAGIAAEREFCSELVSLADSMQTARLDLQNIEAILGETPRYSSRFWFELEQAQRILRDHAGGVLLVAAAVFEEINISGTEATKLFERGAKLQ